MDQRRTDSGHLALIVTDLCPSGIDQVRTCHEGEAPGVIITAYAGLASDYSKTVFVLPLLDHFFATDNLEHIPVLSSGSSLRAAQIEYWRKHLRPYIPPMTAMRYDELRADLDRFDAGRTVRHVLTMEFLGTLMASHKHQDATEPIALIDPQTKELIPDGRWREAVGTEYMRSAVIVTAPASLEQELRLVQYLQNPPFKTFNALSANCSDFVERALLAVYGDAGLHFRARQIDFADAWITSPLIVATGFVSYLKNTAIPMRVVFVPITAGTRRSHFSVHAISRGALVPDPSQGKLAFSVKAYLTFLNPLLGTTSFTVDQLSRLVDLPRVIHDCSSGDFLTVGVNGQTCSGQIPKKHDGIAARDRIRVFGTALCWKKKQDEFQSLASQAIEIGLLDRESKKLILKRGEPFLLPRLYEHPAGDKSLSQPLLAGMQSCLQPTCRIETNLLKTLAPVEAPLLTDETIPARSQIRVMADSTEAAVRQTAFKLMVSVINYDLASEPADRRSVQSFDRDWQLLVNVAEKNDLSVSAPVASETLESCSCQSFDSGVEDKDAWQVARGFGQTVQRVGRDLINSPVR